MRRWFPLLRTLSRIGLLSALAVPALAATLPLRGYTTDDGLPGNAIIGITGDRGGYLWFLTTKGVARFDGQVFTALGPRDGLPEASAWDLLETREGEVFVALWAGLFMLNPSAATREETFHRIELAEGGGGEAGQSLLQDSRGAIWYATAYGLFRLARGGSSWALEKVSLGALDDEPILHLTALAEDRSGALWIGVRDGRGLIRRDPDGGIERFLPEQGLLNGDVRSLLLDSTGRLWVGTTGGLGVLDPEAPREAPLLRQTFREAQGLPGFWISSLLEDSSGQIWAATNRGLGLMRPHTPPGGPPFHTYTTREGLESLWVQGLCEDGEGNLWLGSPSSGVQRLAWSGFTSFGLADGLREDPEVNALVLDRRGEVCAITGIGGLDVNCFEGDHITSVRPGLPGEIEMRGWSWNQTIFQDSTGSWWVPTFQGAYRFPAVQSLDELRGLAPAQVYTTADGLHSDEVFSLFEDSQGDVWIGTTHQTTAGAHPVHRWDRSSDRIDDYGDVETIPREIVTAFGEDGSGDLWIGFYGSGVGRLRGRRFTLFGERNGLPRGLTEAFHLDDSGRLWIAIAERGVFRIDDPGADEPRAVRYSMAEGLASDWTRCVTNDRWGRIFIGTDRGVDRLDPETGHVQHLGRAEGLAAFHVMVALRDKEGTLWFGTRQGVSRLVPAPERATRPPPIRILGLRLNGEDESLPVLGARNLAALEMGPGRSHLEIEYSALGLAPGDEIRYQYRLHDRDEWSEPISERKLNFAGLGSGRYHLELRALNSGGLVSPHPASLSFRVLPPFWRRAWFVALCVLAVAAAAYGGHRLRLRRVVELERIRTRIATDLHDDIGSSLSQVSILSEVVRHQIDGKDPGAARPLLQQIAGTARELIDSMGDIVWAINPERDRTADLVKRMRRFASDSFTGAGVRLRFEAPREGAKRRLDLELRRQVFLIFKEAVNNAVRHSGCGEARVEVELERGRLSFGIEDDGKGFDPRAADEGNGLASMRARARALGGDLEITSTEGEGTRVRLSVPLAAGSARRPAGSLPA